MIGVVYLGNNPKTQERLRYIPGQLVRMTNAYKDAAQICTPHVANEHFLVFFERNVRSEDITAITYLRKKCPRVYIVLMTNTMTEDERRIYMKCGINDTIHQEASVTELNTVYLRPRECIIRRRGAQIWHLKIQDSRLEAYVRYYFLNAGHHCPVAHLHPDSYCH